MNLTRRHFACTQCGKCCDRSPEVELSEAAPLADMFVFRLMFRLYRLARFPAQGSGGDAQAFYEKKRLLNAHAARAYATKVVCDGKPVEHINYLMISALALDTRQGACAALDRNLCSIHDRRPLTCRTLPFHYSRGERRAQMDFDVFVNTPGYGCDTSPDAPVLLEGDRITDKPIAEARRRAAAIAERDFRWKQAIVRAMKVSRDGTLPTLAAVEANAALGAMTSSMRIGWEIGIGAGAVNEGELKPLLRTQLATIEREIGAGLAPREDQHILHEMRAEYRQALGD